MSPLLATKRYQGRKDNVDQNIFYETYMEAVSKSKLYQILLYLYILYSQAEKIFLHTFR